MHASETISATEHILALRKYPRKPAYALAALEDVYAHFGQIPEDSQAVIRAYFSINELPGALRDTLFHEMATNQSTVKVCTGPLCIQKGSDQLAGELLTISGIAVERQHCMGACHLAPNVKVGDELISEASFSKISSQL
jgi:NADH:ubiquinone oxidoreductase subunit E